MVADVIEIPAPNSIWIVQVDSFVLVFAVLGPDALRERRGGIARAVRGMLFLALIKEQLSSVPFMRNSGIPPEFRSVPFRSGLGAGIPAERA